jgi:hypothetical protein
MASLATIENALLDEHLDREPWPTTFPPVVELDDGRWYDTTTRRFITDAEGFRRDKEWEASTPYWEVDAARVAWRNRKGA